MNYLVNVFKSITKRLRENQIVRCFVEEIKLAMLYRRLKPESVELANSRVAMFVDRKDTRGRLILLCNAQGQSNLKGIWHRAIVRLKPDVVIDVGANYGEFLFGEIYDSHSKIIGIEANPKLAHCLKRSLKGHPSQNQINIVTALAADKSDQSIDFFIDQGSSGRSTAVKRLDTTSIAQTSKTVAIDDLLAGMIYQNNCVVFKIDVEGFEPWVLVGMKELIAKSECMIGIIEFNPKLILLSGWSPQAFINDLKVEFEIYALNQIDGSIRLMDNVFEQIEKIIGSQKFEIDLLLVKKCNKNNDWSKNLDIIMGLT